MRNLLYLSQLHKKEASMGRKENRKIRFAKQ
jgi:hypothetical protein